MIARCFQLTAGFLFCRKGSTMTEFDYLEYAEIYHTHTTLAGFLARVGEKHQITDLEATQAWRIMDAAMDVAPSPDTVPVPAQSDLASAIAHRACHSGEHCPEQGRLHGFCIVCGIPWPCDTAKYFLRDKVSLPGGNVSCPSELHVGPFDKYCRHCHKKVSGS